MCSGYFYSFYFKFPLFSLLRWKMTGSTLPWSLTGFSCGCLWQCVCWELWDSSFIPSSVSLNEPHLYVLTFSLIFVYFCLFAPLWVLRELFPLPVFRVFHRCRWPPFPAFCFSFICLMLFAGIAIIITSSTPLSVFSHDLPRFPHPSYAFQCAVDAVWSYFNSLFLSFSVFKTLLFFHYFFLSFPSLLVFSW